MALALGMIEVDINVLSFIGSTSFLTSFVNFESLAQKVPVNQFGRELREASRS